jgi:hypothetical protein
MDAARNTNRTAKGAAMTTKTSRTAKAAYTARRTEIATMIAQLQDALKADDERLAGREPNWADAGDMAEIARNLEAAVRFATGAED